MYFCIFIISKKCIDFQNLNKHQNRFQDYKAEKYILWCCNSFNLHICMLEKSHIYQSIIVLMFSSFFWNFDMGIFKEYALQNISHVSCYRYSHSNINANMNIPSASRFVSTENLFHNTIWMNQIKCWRKRWLKPSIFFAIGLLKMFL